jgi:hypothetical protein
MAYAIDNTFKNALANQIGTGKGKAVLYDTSQSERTLDKAQGFIEKDMARMEEAEKQRIIYGKEVGDIKLDGWDVDTKRQLGGQLSDLKKYYSEEAAKGINVLDPKNEAEYAKYHYLKDNLTTDMASSKDHKAMYKTAMGKFLADKDSFDQEATKANFEKYRQGLISERDMLAGDLLVPRIKNGAELLQDTAGKHFKPITWSKGEIISEGPLKGGRATKAGSYWPQKEMEEYLEQEYSNMKSTVGEMYREEYETLDDLKKASKKSFQNLYSSSKSETAPPPPKESKKVWKSYTQDNLDMADTTHKLVENIQKGLGSDESQIKYLENEKYGETPIDNAIYTNVTDKDGNVRPAITLTLETQEGQEKGKEVNIYLDEENNGAYNQIYKIINGGYDAKDRIAYPKFVEIVNRTIAQQTDPSQTPNTGATGVTGVSGGSGGFSEETEEL